MIYVFSVRKMLFNFLMKHIEHEMHWIHQEDPNGSILDAFCIHYIWIHVHNAIVMNCIGLISDVRYIVIVKSCIGSILDILSIIMLDKIIFIFLERNHGLDFSSTCFKVVIKFHFLDVILLLFSFWGTLTQKSCIPVYIAINEGN